MTQAGKQLARARLDCLCRLVTDGTHDSPKLQQSGIPFVKGKHISGGYVDLENCDHIAKEDHEKAIQRSKPERGDILFSNIGSVGDAAFINMDKEFSIKNVALFKPNPDVVDNKYLYYVVLGPKFRGELFAKRLGVAQPFFSLEMLRSHEVEYHHDLTIQKKIAPILSAYDDLIENNLRRIKILEEMAQTIYREWFVKFRFPGHEKIRMVDSPLGKIPEGWKVVSLVDVCNIVMGQSPKSEFYNTRGDGLPFHQGVTNFGPRFPTERVFCTVKNRIAETGEILFSVRAPVGRINIADKRLIVGRGLCAIHNNEGNQWFTFHQLKERFQDEDMMGGGTIFKAVTRKDVESIEFLNPANLTVRAFEEICHPVEAQIEILTDKNATLRHTRDLLLPKLISGELDVSDLDIKTGGHMQ